MKNRVMSNDQARILKKTKKTVSFIAKLLLGLLFISPLLVGLLFSFVPNEKLNGRPPTLGEVFENFTFENYNYVIHAFPVGRFLWNTLVICIIIIVSSTILCSFAAYSFAFFRFPGRALLFNSILVAMMIPGDAIIIANFLNVQKWGMLNSYTGMVITSLVGGTDIFLIRQSFMQMPRDLSEAAIMDGCGRIRFLFSIGIPMAMPAITSLAITGFIGAYNMYFWPLLVAQTKDMQTIQIGMAMIRGLEVAQYGSILAGAVVCAVIPIILFIFAQDFIIKGLSTGSVKG